MNIGTPRARGRKRLVLKRTDAFRMTNSIDPDQIVLLGTALSVCVLFA